MDRKIKETIRAVDQIGKLFSNWRYIRGFHFRHIGEILDISPKYVSDIEHGNIGKTIKKLAEENDYLKEQCSQCERCSAYIPADENFCDNCADEGFYSLRD